MTAQTPTAPGRTKRHLLLNWGPTVLFSVVLPFITYSMLTSRGVGEVAALLLAGCWPLVEQVVFFALHRRIDELTALILIFMALGVLAALGFNSPRLILVKDSALTGLFGVVTLLSLFAPRPLMFYFGRKFGTNGTPESIAEWNGYWAMPGFRRTQRIITVVWGVAFLAEAAVRIALAYVLPTETMVLVNGILPIALVAGVIFWTIRYAKRSRAAGLARAAAARAQQPTA